MSKPGTVFTAETFARALKELKNPTSIQVPKLLMPRTLWDDIQARVAAGEFDDNEAGVHAYALAHGAFYDTVWEPNPRYRKAKDE